MNTLPCIVTMNGPGGQSLEVVNLGYGNWLNPLSGATLDGDNTVCTLGDAKNVAAIMASDTGFPVVAQADPDAAFPCIASAEKGTVVYGPQTDESDTASVYPYILVRTDDVPLAAKGFGNAQAWLTAIASFFGGDFTKCHFAYSNTKYNQLGQPVGGDSPNWPNGDLVMSLVAGPKPA